MSIIYIGAFPPKWGGVTVKNNDLFNEFAYRGLSVKKVDIGKAKRDKSVAHILSLFKALTGTDDKLIIGVSAASRCLFVKIMYLVNRNVMHRSIMFVMGGAAAREIAGDSKDKKRMSEFKQIYVETPGMQKMLLSCGMKNVSVYPNCRKRTTVQYLRTTTSERLRCVFFSLIQKEKGVPEILEAAGKLPDVDFYFYGHIDGVYQDEFEREIHSLPNCCYKGVFRGDENSKYRELSQYDILLLPSHYDREGIPGALVEAKIAGLACIVSDVSYNREIVQDKINGIVLERNDATCLTEAIRLLDADRNMLVKQKQESFHSAEQYYMENYMDSIIHMITD